MKIGRRDVVVSVKYDHDVTRPFFGEVVGLSVPDDFPGETGIPYQDHLLYGIWMGRPPENLKKVNDYFSPRNIRSS